jgi:hypothetical protein
VCTVSVLPRSTLAARGVGLERPLVRVVCNRDELRARPAAVPPALRLIGERRVAMPVDPVGGGSWIAVNDCSVVFALLNARASQARPSAAQAERVVPPVSRGLIIPAVAGSHSVAHALEQAERLEVSHYLPFRLLLIDRHQMVECWPQAGRLCHRRTFLGGPTMRTSSGLGDGVVLAPRRTLFRRFFSAARDPLAAQDAFHEHQWLGREDISVRMERDEARTVSRTVVCVGPGVATMTYCAADTQDEHRVFLGVHADDVRTAMCS